mgnify:CR=1 FL=1|tara:strand:- start:1831 stop:2013 length:183 start_codon:yes stop_codon:yes gene_type:complete
MDGKELSPAEQFYVQRYDFIYRELNRLQDNMDVIEQATSKLLNELEELRNKEKTELNNNG